MLKMLEAIFEGKIATENIETTGSKRMRGELQSDGACACGDCGAAFGVMYAVVGSAADVVPVDIALPGCPPRPSAMLVVLCAAAACLKKKYRHADVEQFIIFCSSILVLAVNQW